MTETLVQWFVTHLGGTAAKELIIFIISMIPILELRGGILAAGPAFLNIPTWRAIPICLVGNLIPIPFILLLIRPIFAWLRKTRLFRPLVEKLEKKELMSSFYKAVDMLPAQKQDICLMKVQEELTNQEIAERMNLSVNTIKTHYSEALKLLRIHLSKMLIIVAFTTLMTFLSVHLIK